MSDLNRATIGGRLTADPELKQTPDGKMVCNFTVACNRYNDDADFIDVVAWNNKAEFVARNFYKGKMIIVEGSLRTRVYENKKYNDVKHKITSVQASNIYFAGDKKVTNPVAVATEENKVEFDLSEFEEVADNGDLPF